MNMHVQHEERLINNAGHKDINDSFIMECCYAATYDEECNPPVSSQTYGVSEWEMEHEVMQSITQLSMGQAPLWM